MLATNVQCGTVLNYEHNGRTMLCSVDNIKTNEIEVTFFNSKLNHSFKFSKPLFKRFTTFNGDSIYYIDDTIDHVSKCCRYKKHVIKLAFKMFKEIKHVERRLEAVI